MFPSQVEEVLSQVDGISSEYRIDIAHDETTNKDVMLLTAEAEGRVDFKAAEKLLAELFKSRMSMTPKVTIVPIETLPRSEKKTQRVFDHREV